MASIIGTSGTKTFWRGTTDYHFAGVAGCRACGSELAAKLCLRTIYETTPNAMVFGRSCGAGRSELQTGGRIGCDGSGLTGIWAGMKARGIADRNLVCLTGEGRTLEMGFGGRYRLPGLSWTTNRMQRAAAQRLPLRHYTP